VLTREQILRPENRAKVFTDENDHNPLVPEGCRACGGTGICGEAVHIDDNYAGEEDYICEICAGSGVTGRLVPFFDNQSEPVESAVRPDGWTRCPACGKMFSTADPYRWTGLRHVSCGQRITLRRLRGKAD
jgi:hypothetical protein